ncbi:hypothetical protein F9L16_23670 [Agarivorans sp. B2Z047]|uniref:hypothetical protein n=1 Tax=Agarivorans sp. B2Z047 TaxID=2652721 RepID=UPI00128BD620|nr:hypothetical protein [Agarivorans sp. B2Z047]MPW31957.1 hypothetical protein [Agarivorans sp. B2Z047]UQN41878.1 hypothetical protein LQZ07_19180 [Agarivorans sp. B2Z047]UQN44889.1 hypothetical protein LQZ07_10615 [Agarivorans sp. B2Z047]
MSVLVRNYNQALTVVIVDLIPQVGLFEGDPIRLIPNEEGSAITTGTYESTTSFSTDQSGQLEVDYKPGSASLIQLKTLWRNQKTFRAKTFSIQLVTGVGEPVSLQGCSIQSIGQSTTGGKVQQVKTVIFNIEKITETI